MNSDTPALAPRLTVVMPTHRRRELVLRSLRALAEQEVQPGTFDLVLVVDGDGDGTESAVRGVATPFVVEILQQPKTGVASARNRGWHAARGEIVLFLDDDIVALPGLIAEHLRWHEQPRRVVIGRFSPDPALRRTAWQRYEELVQEKKYRALMKDERPSAIRLYSGNFSVRREHLEATGGFASHLPRNEDVDLGFRLQELGLEFVFAPAADSLHCGYRDFEGWISMPSLYGRLDVAMYRRAGYVGGLETIVACYHDRHPLNRAAIRIALSSHWWLRLVSRALGTTGRVAYLAGLEKVSFFALSAVSNIQYWAGVRDGMRGNASFWALVRKTRGDSRRPYQRSAEVER